MIREGLIENLQVVLGFDKETSENIAKSFPDDYNAYRLWAILTSKKITMQNVPKQVNGINVLYEIFFLEAVIFYKKGNALDKLKKLMRDNLEYEDKETLLTEFLFSDKYKFKDSYGDVRHLMFDDFNQDTHFKNLFYLSPNVQYCSGGNAPLCYCRDWLRENRDKVNIYIDVWVERLSEMRNAVVHEASPLFFLPQYDGKQAIGSFNSSVRDAYPLKKKIFRSYQSYIDPEIFFSITSKCIKSYLSSMRNVVRPPDANGGTEPAV